MGMINAAQMMQPQGMSMGPAQRPPMQGGAPPNMRGGLSGAFSGNPQFQQQLQQMMQMQGPGMQAPQFTPPPGGPMSTQIPGANGVAGHGAGDPRNPGEDALRQFMLARFGGMQV